MSFELMIHNSKFFCAKHLKFLQIINSIMIFKKV